MAKTWGAVALAVALAGFAGGGVAFESPEAAIAKSAATGKPICWYFTNDAPGGASAAGWSGPNCAKANGAFAKPSVTLVKTSSEFICVKGTQKHASQFKVKGAPLVVITDPDGEEILRSSIMDGEAQLAAAWEAALKKYASRAISWKDSAVSDSKKLLVVAFDDGKGEAAKALEDRMLVKLHDRCEFVKLAYEKEGENAKKWNVVQAPTIVLCDSSRENPERNPIDKLAGKKSPASIKAALLRALRKVEDKK